MTGHFFGLSVFLDVGSHALDLIDFLLGPLDRVRASASASGRRTKTWLDRKLQRAIEHYENIDDIKRALAPQRLRATRVLLGTQVGLLAPVSVWCVSWTICGLAVRRTSTHVCVGCI